MAYQQPDLDTDACPSRISATHQQAASISSDSDSSGDEGQEIVVHKVKNDGKKVTINHMNSDGSKARIKISKCDNLQIGNNNVMIINQSGSSGKASCKTNVTVKQRPREELTDSKSKPSQKDFFHVCQNVNKGWQKLGHNLGLTDPEIDQIDYDYNREGVSEVVWQVLQKWTRKGDNVTVQRLAQALYDSGKVETAFKLPVSR